MRSLDRSPQVSRRGLLVGVAAGLAANLVGCTPNGKDPKQPESVPDKPAAEPQNTNSSEISPVEFSDEINNFPLDPPSGLELGKLRSKEYEKNLREAIYRLQQAGWTVVEPVAFETYLVTRVSAKTGEYEERWAWVVGANPPDQKYYSNLDDYPNPTKIILVPVKLKDIGSGKIKDIETDRENYPRVP